MFPNPCLCNLGTACAARWLLQADRQCAVGLPLAPHPLYVCISRRELPEALIGLHGRLQATTPSLSSFITYRSLCIACLLLTAN